MDTTTLVGFFAAFCTSASYFPQLKKYWQTGKAEDLSFLMFSTLTTGVGAWVLYGILKQDLVIIIANAVSFCCLAGILWFICGRPRLAMVFCELLIGRFHMSGLFCAEQLFRWP
jgi:MtN3 and saliva related transmembrane protein